MSQSATPVFRFVVPAPLPLEARFDGGRLASDGGLPWLDAAETAVGVCADFAAAIPEWRRGPVRHALETLVRQRVFQIACGYEDQDDADTLRTDPLLKLVCGRLPETGADLASQPTLSRLENAVDWRACYRLLAVLAAPLVAEAQRQRAATGAEKVRLVGETVYQAESWARPRRVVIKAEALPKGPNTRFVVTSRSAPPEALYAWYVDRGEGENWIKDLKRACFADRLSDHRCWANQCRLLLHAAAYWLLDTVRRWLVACAVPALQLDTLRLRLLKIGGRVYQLQDRVRLRLAASHPGQPLWLHLAAHHPLRE